MQIVIDIPNSDISLKQNVITLDLHFIDGHICECTYPFKELLKGHGRLIDADALVVVFKDMAKCEWNQKVSPISWAYAFEDTIDEIDNAPTILEAEES